MRAQSVARAANPQEESEVTVGGEEGVKWGRCMGEGSGEGEVCRCA